MRLNFLMRRYSVRTVRPSARAACSLSFRKRARARAIRSRSACSSVGIGSSTVTTGASDLVTRSEGVGPLEEVLELAHVTGEVVRGQRRDRIGGDALDVTPETLVEPPE